MMGLSLFSRALNIYRRDGLDQLLSRAEELALEQYGKPCSRFIGRHVQLWPRGVNVERPIFIVGSSRSGTSVFTRCLERHPQIGGWSEAGTVWDKDYYQKDSDHRRTAADASRDECKRIRDTFLTYLSLARKERFLNKHPRNSLRIEFIREIFPDALFVYMVRHPVGAVESMARRAQEGDRRHYPYGRFTKPPRWREDVGKPPLEQFAHSWAKINDHLSERTDDSFHTVKYEEFCASPHVTIASTCSFAGLDSSAYPSRMPENVQNMNKKAADNLSQDELDCLWDIVANTATEFGYNDRPE